jgi:xylulokinase
LIFLPYLTGERTPLMDAQARGAFIGLTAYHTRAHLIRAVMEGVAFSMRQAFAVAQELGGQADVMIANGGGMESDVWRGIMADVLGRPLEQRAVSDHAALGAALIAGVATSIYANFDETRSVTARTRSVTMPDPARSRLYQELFEQYVQLYPKLRGDFHALARRTQAETMPKLEPAST